MPKKLFDFNLVGHYQHSFGPQMITGSPILCIKIAYALSIWTRIDSIEVPSLIAIINHTNPELAVAMFESINGLHYRQRMLEAAAVIELTKEQCEVLSMIMKKYKQQGDIRNKLAHSVWGYSENLDNHLLAMAPRDYKAGTKDRTDAFASSNALHILDDNIKEHFNKIDVYDEHDFDNILNDLYRLLEYFGTFNCCIDPRFFDQMVRDRELKKLRAKISGEA